MVSIRDRLDRAIELTRQGGFPLLLRRARRFIGRKLLIDKVGISRLIAVAGQARTVKQAVDLAFSFEYLDVSIRPWQVREELNPLLDMVKGLNPRVILEIGTAEGGTLFMLTRVANPGALIISVDLPGGMFGGGYPKSRIPLYESFAMEGQSLHLVRGDSHSQDTLGRIKEILANRSVDFLFIDGDHRYEGVKEDFEMYSPLVRPGGLIAFHDICPGSEEKVGGVPAFWKEVCKNRGHRELVDNWDQGFCGIGVVFVDGS